MTSFSMARLFATLPHTELSSDWLSIPGMSHTGSDVDRFRGFLPLSGSDPSAASRSTVGIGITAESPSTTTTHSRRRQKETVAEGNSFPPLPSVETITSPSNPYIKHCVKLRTSSTYRRAAKSLLIVGGTPLKEICGTSSTSLAAPHPRPRPQLLFIREKDVLPPALADLHPPRVIRVSDAVMGRLAGMESSEGVDAVGVMEMPGGFVDLGVGGGGGGGETEWLESWRGRAKHVVALDGIQDPGNLGTLLRTAAAFAWDGVFLLPGCCDPFNQKALRASRGCAFRLPLIVGEWDDLLSWTTTNSIPLFAADPGDESGNSNIPNEDNEGVVGEAKSLDSLEVACRGDKICLVLGSEGQGVSEIAIEHCRRVSIPMPGGVESLNVAVAGGILLYLLKSQALAKS